MHRAEKSSSKICRAREVEKAQELHRKKIDGVKSCMYGIVSKPRSSTSFNLRPARSNMGSFSSITCVQGEPPLNAESPTAKEVSQDELGLQKDGKSGDSSGTSETWILDNTTSSNSSQKDQPLDEFQRSLAKMEEFRAVAPVPGLGSIAPAKPHSSKLAAPPARSQTKSMNGSVRARRLNEIKHDNVEVFERIRKSASHYSNDELRREWQKNVSYLSSISEFPVSDSSLVSGNKHHNSGYESRSCFGPPPRRSSFLRTTNRPEPLPGIPVIAHPIKCIPTSPKKLQLNMTPGFRSLRKAMPQQPSLPPISSPHCILSSGASGSTLTTSNNVLLSPRDRNTCPNNPGIDHHFAESISGQKPYRSSTAIASTKFVGDLHGNEISGDAKYQLLKTGRFVGGTYLVLTVFCGDSVTNPYGFDVFAYHRELQCEYKLIITKGMTHELLDKSSSSTLAATTAAAAGTNLSMQEIARNICDHINFALLGADQGEIVFLSPNVDTKSDQAMRFDALPGLVAFCLHQIVEIESDEVINPNNSVSHLVGRKRRAHIFASTCPPKTFPGKVPVNAPRIDGGMDTTDLTVCFQIVDTMSYQSIAPILSVEASVNELYDTILLDSWRNQQHIVSLERMVVAAIQHLHIISVPDRYDVSTLTNELIVNSHVNTLLQPCCSRPVGTSALEKKRSRQQLPHSTSQLFTSPIRTTLLTQSGLIWRNCYLLAEVALDTVGNDINRDTWPHHSRRRFIQDANSDLIVSVFNSNSGHSSSRRLAPATTSFLLERLKTKSNVHTGEDINEQHTFARQLLTHLQLDVDLFGQEVIVFPALEHPHSAVNSEEPERQSDETAPPEEHTREFSLLRTNWDEENISEGGEEVASDGYDSKELEEARDEYDVEEEKEQDDTNSSFASYANQDEANLDESLEGPKTHSPKGKETPENEAPPDLEPSIGCQWRQGRKIDGRFCLLQNSSDGTRQAYTIAALGQLDLLHTL
ncbi:hypothetical protein F442_01045 [Phytophthora nicotianae P10297]|uniref:Uncharacterized protein n=1 Tax=Phytophthora nicotianae P10297 TaxID=1317064 RepID=W3A4I1_PHYNI|nr:hypothetical protein F442_01045 [Phytophthora nicotianae P10297]